MSENTLLNELLLKEAGMTIHRHEAPSSDKGSRGIFEGTEAVLERITSKHKWATEISRGFLKPEKIVPLEADLDKDIKDCLEKTRQHLKIDEQRPPHDSQRLKTYSRNYPEANAYSSRQKRAEYIVEKSVELHGELETAWGNVFKEGVLGTLTSLQRGSCEVMCFLGDACSCVHHRSHSSQLNSGDSHYLRHFRIASEDTWYWNRDGISHYEVPGSEAKIRLSFPKPDVYIAFKAHHVQRQADDNKSSSTKFSYMHNDPIISNFEYQHIVEVGDFIRKVGAKLGRFGGFLPTLTKTYREDVDKSYRQDVNKAYQQDVSKKVEIRHIGCFPWFICEYKHDHGTEGDFNKARLQAANGCIMALTILAKLAGHGVSNDIKETCPWEDIRPVFALTAQGPDVSLWVSFVSGVTEARLSFEMHQIWQGSLLKFLDVLELCFFLDKLYDWAILFLRTWISSCLDRWKYMVASHGKFSDKSTFTDSFNEPRIQDSRQASNTPLNSKTKNSLSVGNPPLTPPDSSPSISKSQPKSTDPFSPTPSGRINLPPRYNCGVQRLSMSDNLPTNDGKNKLSNPITQESIDWCEYASLINQTKTLLKNVRSQRNLYRKGASLVQMTATTTSQTDWLRLKQRTKRIEYRNVLPKQRIVLLGISGPKKSTLVNNLLGYEGLVPVETTDVLERFMVFEFRYCESLDYKFKIRINWLNHTQWKTTLCSLLLDYHCIELRSLTDCGIHSEHGKLIEERRNSALQKLKYIYQDDIRLRQILDNTNIESASYDEIFRELIVQFRRDRFPWLKVSDNKPEEFSFDELIDCKDKIQSLLSARISCLIDSITIETRTPLLQNGLVLIDIPTLDFRDPVSASRAEWFVSYADHILILRSMLAASSLERMSLATANIMYHTELAKKLVKRHSNTNSLWLYEYSWSSSIVKQWVVQQQTIALRAWLTQHEELYKTIVPGLVYSLAQMSYRIANDDRTDDQSNSVSQETNTLLRRIEASLRQDFHKIQDNLASYFNAYTSMTEKLGTSWSLELMTNTSELSPHGIRIIFLNAKIDRQELSLENNSTSAWNDNIRRAILKEQCESWQHARAAIDADLRLLSASIQQNICYMIYYLKPGSAFTAHVTGFGSYAEKQLGLHAKQILKKLKILQDQVIADMYRRITQIVMQSVHEAFLRQDHSSGIDIQYRALQDVQEKLHLFFIKRVSKEVKKVANYARDSIHDLLLELCDILNTDIYTMEAITLTEDKVLNLSGLRHTDNFFNDNRDAEQINNGLPNGLAELVLASESLKAKTDLLGKGQSIIKMSGGCYQPFCPNEY